MAISKNIVSLNPGFARTDVIYQLEEQFADLSLHGSGRSGLIVGVTSYTDPGVVGSSNVTYEDVRPISTTGIGTGASFYVYRNSGYVERVHLNRPGYGYTGGEKITISAEDIGGSANGANDIVIQPTVYAHKTSGAQTYNVTLSGFYEVSGTDRNGTIGADKVITIREGDTINFTDDLANTSYGFAICWDRGPFSSAWHPTSQTYNQYYAGATNRVFNAYNSSGNGGGGNVITWKTEYGQRGFYRILDEWNNYGQTDPITIIVEPDDSNWSYTNVGSATTFWAKFSDPDANYPWGVLKHDIEPDKKYGITYRGFQVTNNNKFSVHVGSDFLPSIGNYVNVNSYTGPYQTNRLCGAQGVDMPYKVNTSNTGDNFNDNSEPNNSSDNTYYCQIPASQFTYCNSNAYQLDLTSYKSALDPRFVVYSYRQPTLSSTILSANTFATFILHDHIGTIWDHDNLFTSGVTRVIWSSGNTTDPYVGFRTYIAGEHYHQYSYRPALRAAEYGYANSDFDNYYDFNYFADTYYKPNSYKTGSSLAAHQSRIYYRGLEDRNTTHGITSDLDFNAVIKGIPINSKLIPFPFYMPDDFVLIQFDYASPSANIQQGDTVTVSASEVYEVITGSYNQTDRTRGILFCARTT